MRLFAALSFALLVAACGGSGGGSTTPEDPALQFNPATVSTSTPFGQAGELLIAGTVIRVPATPYFIQVDPASAAVDASSARVTVNLDNTFQLHVDSSPRLAIGAHGGKLKVRLCVDAECSAQHPGSPSEVAYSITVTELHDLKTPVAQEGVNDWVTTQGNREHHGFVPLTVNPEGITVRWVVFNNHPDAVFTPPVLTGQAAVLGASYANSSGKQVNNIVALRETDGSPQFSNIFPFSGKLFAPGYDGTRIYQAHSDGNTGRMYAVDASSGAMLYNSAFPAKNLVALAPVVDGGKLFFNGGDNNDELIRMSTADGTLEASSLLPGSKGWSPGVDSQYVYRFKTQTTSTAGDGGLYLYDRSTLAVVKSILLPGDNSTSSYVGSAPIVDSVNHRVIALTGNLPDASAFNRTMIFDTTADSASNIGDGHSVGAALNPETETLCISDNATHSVKCHNINSTTGHLIGEWVAPVGNDIFGGNMVLTNNLLFVSTQRRTFAIDINTMTEVWRYGAGGHLAISKNGVLYIVGRAVNAVNLK